MKVSCLSSLPVRICNTGDLIQSPVSNAGPTKHAEVLCYRTPPHCNRHEWVSPQRVYHKQPSSASTEPLKDNKNPCVSSSLAAMTLSRPLEREHRSPKLRKGDSLARRYTRGESLAPEAYRMRWLASSYVVVLPGRVFRCWFGRRPQGAGSLGQL
jgi:hypothetical protein